MAAPQSFAREVPLSPRPPESGGPAQASAGELRAYHAMFAIVVAALLVPIWMVDYPGMVDYPNHLVRCFILAHYHNNPLWPQRFILDLHPTPNLAIELIVVPLLRLLPLLVCGKIFLSIAAALYAAGCSAVGRAVAGRPNWLALACAFTFYSSPLLFGYVNYVFGLGVFLCAFAYWLHVRNAMTPVRFLLCCLLGMAAFFAHLSSVAILGAACCTVALFEFARKRKIRAPVIQLAWLACPAIFMAVFMKSSGHVGTIVWSSPYKKLIHLFAPVRSYNTMVDVAAIAVLLVCAVALLKGSRIHLVAAAGAALFLLYAITPAGMLTTWDVDTRYVIPGYLLLALSIQPRRGRWQKAAMAAALAVMAIHTASVAANWLTIDRRSEQVLAMGKILPPEARVFAFPQIEETAPTAKLDRGFVHTIMFWALSNGADVSSFFAYPGAQPLVFRDRPCDEYEWEKCIAGYGYAWTCDPPAALRRGLQRIATPAAAWEGVVLWRIDTKAAAALRVP